MKTSYVFLSYDQRSLRFQQNELDKFVKYTSEIPRKTGPWLYETRKTQNIFFSHDQGSSKYKKKNVLDKFIKYTG